MLLIRVTVEAMALDWLEAFVDAGQLSQSAISVLISDSIANAGMSQEPPLSLNFLAKAMCIRVRGFDPNLHFLGW